MLGAPPREGWACLFVDIATAVFNFTALDLLNDPLNGGFPGIFGREEPLFIDFFAWDLLSMLSPEGCPFAVLNFKFNGFHNKSVTEFLMEKHFHPPLSGGVLNLGKS